MPKYDKKLEKTENVMILIAVFLSFKDVRWKFT